MDINNNLKQLNLNSVKHKRSNIKLQKNIMTTKNTVKSTTNNETITENNTTQKINIENNTVNKTPKKSMWSKLFRIFK